VTGITKTEIIRKTDILTIDKRNAICDTLVATGIPLGRGSAGRIKNEGFKAMPGLNRSQFIADCISSFFTRISESIEKITDSLPVLIRPGVFIPVVIARQRSYYRGRRYE
jgi:hypothetical protein